MNKLPIAKIYDVLPSKLRHKYRFKVKFCSVKRLYHKQKGGAMNDKHILL